MALVFTHEDSPTEEIWFASVRELADRHGIPYLTSDINEPANVARLREIAPDFILSFYYRNMIRPAVLDIPRRGALNLHGSYLPRYRGRVPVNWAVINGETETGATLHYMVEKPDAGDIVDREKVTIEFTDTALDVFNKVTEAAVTVISRSWPLLLAGTAPRIPMDLKAGNYLRRPEAGRRPDRLDQKRRADLQPHPRRHPPLSRRLHVPGRKEGHHLAGLAGGGDRRTGEVVSTKPLLVGTGEGLLEIRSLQVEGEEEITAAAFCRQGKLLQRARFELNNQPASRKESYARRPSTGAEAYLNGTLRSRRAGQRRRRPFIGAVHRRKQP